MAGNAPGRDHPAADDPAVAKRKDQNLDQRCTSKTAKGKQCRNRPIPGLKKCAVHSHSAKAKSSAAKDQVAPAHRPDTITEDRLEQMEDLLKTGQYISVACQLIGIPYSTHKEWMAKGKLEDPKYAPYRIYAERIDKALAEGEQALVDLVTAGAVDDPRLALAMLERRHPERWAKPSQRTHSEAVEAVVMPVAPSSGIDIADLIEKGKGKGTGRSAGQG